MQYICNPAKYSLAIWKCIIKPIYHWRCKI